MKQKGESSVVRHQSVIMIVDDDPFGRYAMEAALFAPEYSLVVARDGQEALDLALQVLPDVILLDVMMPGMDGFEVCRRFRSDPLLAEVPIIMATALADRESRLDGIRAGADEFMSKPIDLVELRTRVRTITRLNRYRRLVEERTRFEWVLEQSEDGYVLLNDRDEILYANPRARRYLDLSEDSHEVLYEQFMPIAQKRYRTEPSEAWAQWPAINLTPANELLFLVRPESSAAPAAWLEMTLLDQTDGQADSRLIRLRDVTSEISTERTMWTFHSMIRHKLNTPLHIVSSSMELLALQDSVELETGSSRELVNWTLQGMQRLKDSLADILQYIEAPLIARSGMRFSLDQLAPVAGKMAIELGLASLTVRNKALPGVQLILSSNAVQCILRELVENSKKFHPAGKPSVEIVITPRDGNMVSLQVIDDGLTLAPEELERMWLPYYQNERFFTGEVPGMGLGLSMVRFLIWEVGGSCHVVNRENGAGVIVELVVPTSERDRVDAQNQEVQSSLQGTETKLNPRSCSTSSTYGHFVVKPQGRYTQSDLY